MKRILPIILVISAIIATAVLLQGSDPVFPSDDADQALSTSTPVTPRPICVGSAPVSRFRLLVEPPGGGPAIPLSAVNRLEPGDRLKYEPIRVPDELKTKARVAIILVPFRNDSDDQPAGKGEKKKGKEKKEQEKKGANLEVLEAKPAAALAEWDVTARAVAVGVVFGPHGLNVKKVSSLMEKNPELLSQLADYAQETSTVQALVELLQQQDASQASGGQMNAALAGFGSQYGVMMPRLDPAVPTDQQADLLLRAVLPTLSTYDPLNASRAGTVEQSAGLAGSVASLFLGTPVGLAAGGAALVVNLRTLVFPDTDFRAAFTLPTPSATPGAVIMCAKFAPPRSRTQLAYLWMLRVPDAPPPSVALASVTRLPLGAKSTVAIRSTPAQSKLLTRARNWQLVPVAAAGKENTDEKEKAGFPGSTSSGSEPAKAPSTETQIAAKKAPQLPVPVKVESAQDLSLDLTNVKLEPGEYRLAASWDWQPFEVAGPVDVLPFGDLGKARLTPESEDRLVVGSGTVPVTLAGTNFEFVKKVTLVHPADLGGDEEEGARKTLPFALGKSVTGGDKTNLTTRIDTRGLAAGAYQLELAQSNGKSSTIPIEIHPPDPKLERLPLRANLGQPEQALVLRGSGLERIEKITSSGATWDLAPAPPGAHDLTERQVTLKLQPSAKVGAILPAEATLEGLHQALQIPNAVEVAGPRPRIAGIRQSFSSKVDLELRPGEMPAGAVVSFSIQAENAGKRPSVGIACANAADMRQAVELHPGDRNGGAQLDLAGNGALFLSLDPAMVGESGCQLTMSVTADSTGTSDPYNLGRLVRVPRIEKFTLSDQKTGTSLYDGLLTGWDLQTIEKAGWEPQTGFPVQGIATAVPGGSAGEQTVEIALPWPPPSPRAPLYVWLRGDTAGRLTQARY